MSGRTRKVDIEYIAKIDKLERELAKLPGISEKEARAMVKGLDKELKKATKAAQRAARQQKAAFDKVKGTAEGTKRVADALGGSLGSTAGSIEHMARSVLELTGALGPAGAGIAAVTILTTGLGAAGAAAALNANELQKELEEAGRTPVITGEQRRQVEKLDAGMRELKMRTKELVVAFGAEFAPAMTTVVVGLADLVEGGRKVVTLWTFLRDGSLFVAKAFATMGTSIVDLNALEGLTGLVMGYSDATAQAVIDTEELAKRQKRLNAELDAYVSIQDKVIKEIAEERAEAEKKAQREAEKAAEEAQRLAAKIAAERERATDRLRAITAQAQGAQLEGEAKIQFELEQRLAQIAELEAVSRNSAAAEQARQEVTARAAQQTTQVIRDEIEKRIEAYEQAQAAQIRTEEAALAASLRASAVRTQIAQKEADEAEAQAKEWRDARAHSAEVAISLARQLTEVYLDSDREWTESAKKSAMKAFRIQQALAITQIAIATATGIARAMEAGPYAAIPLAAAAAATGGMQTALVATQAPPEFPFGGVIEPAQISAGPRSIDHTVVAAVEPEEAILNRSAVNRLGRAGVDALNRGGDAGSSTTVIMQYKHRVFDAFVQDNLAKGGPLDDAIKQGRRPGHRRRRRVT